jgi:hypothetical protein
MPLMLPNTAARPVAGMPALPPAVVAVWVPWPLKSRGDRYSYGGIGVDDASRPSAKYCAPISF